MTIGVLAPYRNIGIGTKLLQQVLEACSKQADCEELYLHVQVPHTPAPPARAHTHTHTHTK